MSIKTATLRDSAETLCPRPRGAPASGGGPTSALANDDVAKMAAAGLPAIVIVGWIKESQCRFDLRPDALIKLRAVGVSEAVLKAMTWKR
jgi:hypothetical protein